MSDIPRTPELEQLAVKMVGYLALRLDAEGLAAASRPVAYDVIAAMLKTAADDIRQTGRVEVPQFKHDCAKCTFLGTLNHHDLYHCTQGGGRPTVIARYGDDGADYLSGLPFVHSAPELHEAAKRAIVRDLLV